MHTNIHRNKRTGTEFSKLAPVLGASIAEAQVTRDSGIYKRPADDERGIEMARFVLAMAAGKGNPTTAVEVAKAKLGPTNSVVTALKAAVAAGNTLDPDWAAPLVDSYQRFAGDFVEFLRPQTIIGRFGTGNIPALRRVPFNISIPTQTSGGAGYWVGEGRAAPVTSFAFDQIKLGWAKVANIAVITRELARWSTPDAESIVRDQLAAALIERLDTDFIDPAKALVANVSPASITHGVTALESVGDDADSVRRDIARVMATYIAQNQTPNTGVWIMSSLIALSLSLMVGPIGQYEFPTVSLKGGTLFGMPIIVSDYVPAGTVVLVNASDVFLADDGAINVSVSTEASLELDSNPQQDSITPNPTPNLVSLWQTNSLGVKCERYINWQKRRPQAVAMLENVNWGNPLALLS